MIEYTIRADRRVVFATLSGVVTTDDVLRHLQNLSEDPAFDRSYGQLLNLEGVKGLSIDSAGMRLIAERHIYLSGAPRAFVASRDELYGMIRMFQVFRDPKDQGENVRVFRSYDAALAWLLSELSTNAACY